MVRLRRRALQQTLDKLSSRSATDDVAAQTVITSYQGRLRTEDALLAALGKQVDGPGAGVGDGNGDGDGERLGELDARLRQAFQEASDIEREIVLEQRTAGHVSPAAADEVLLDIEARAARSGP